MRYGPGDRLPDPSWKSGPPEPDHICREHFRSAECEPLAEDGHLVDPGFCDICERSGGIHYEADREQWPNECEMYEEGHIDLEIVDVVHWEPFKIVVLEHRCECGEVFELEYKYDHTEID